MLMYAKLSTRLPVQGCRRQVRQLQETGSQSRKAEWNRSGAEAGGPLPGSRSRLLKESPRQGRGWQGLGKAALGTKFGNPSFTVILVNDCQG